MSWAEKRRASTGREMPPERAHQEPPALLLAKAKLSLRRSRVRRAVLEYLASIYPRASYPSEIARAIGARADQVLAALTGYKDRYTEDLSLVHLGLVKRVPVRRNMTLYSISKFGMTILRSFSKQPTY
jgi:predicted transcriptional regulator with HTH domain